MKKIEDELFKAGLKEGDLTKISKVSKGDVHNHCGLGMRFTTFNKWAGGSVNKPPNKIDGLKGLDDYIFNETIKFINDKEDIKFLIEETVKEAIRDGVKVLGASIDCHELMRFTDKKEFFSLILNIKNKYNAHIDFRPEVGIPKSITNENLDKLLIPCIESGVFKSIDLYGDETKENFEKFKDYYKFAKEKGLKLKVHSGEFHDYRNVKKAIAILEVDEIQHGIGAVSNEYIMDLIKEKNIRLNICPSSNYILGAVREMKKYPARKLYDKGIVITINTDDLLLFNSGVSEEYLYLYKLKLFDVDELNEIRKNSLI
ncbi:MAG: adenosine deaminase [Tissierellia bacterium]|nr:adenosine deaminase [Tissierellia bacterium]